MGEVDISSCLSINGWMSDNELKWLAETAQKSSTVIEIGSWCGRSSLVIAKYLPSAGTLYCVDAWSQKDVDAGMGNANAEEAMEEFQKNLKPYMDDEKVIMWRSESVEASKVLLHALGGEKIDWIFIDGSHDYESVKADIYAYSPLLKVGGLMSGHDYWHADVHRAVNESFNNIRVQPGTNIWCSIKEDAIAYVR